MKINISGFNISSQGMSVQRKKMNIVAENIAKSDMRTEDGTPYKRKVLDITYKDIAVLTGISRPISENPPMLVTNGNHFKTGSAGMPEYQNIDRINAVEKEDNTPGELVYMPEDPNANENGFVENSNVNVITEMVDMIAASRSYEANLTAFNSSKQIAKDSMDI